MQIFRPDGTFVKKFGRRGHLDGEFNLPQSVTFDTEGLLYIVDVSITRHRRIQIFSDDGTFLRAFDGGTVRRWGRDRPRLGVIRAIAFDPEGRLCIQQAMDVITFKKDGTFVSKWGTPKSVESFDFHARMTIDKGGLFYISCPLDQFILVCNCKGKSLAQFRLPVQRGLFEPTQLVFDDDDTLYVWDRYRIAVFV